MKIDNTTPHRIEKKGKYWNCIWWMKREQFVDWRARENQTLYIFNFLVCLFIYLNRFLFVVLHEGQGGALKRNGHRYAFCVVSYFDSQDKKISLRLCDYSIRADSRSIIVVDNWSVSVLKTLLPIESILSFINEIIRNGIVCKDMINCESPIKTIDTSTITCDLLCHLPHLIAHRSS